NQPQQPLMEHCGTRRHHDNSIHQLEPLLRLADRQKLGGRHSKPDKPEVSDSRRSGHAQVYVHPGAAALSENRPSYPPRCEQSSAQNKAPPSRLTSSTATTGPSPPTPASARSACAR